MANRIKRNKVIQKSVCLLESEWKQVEAESEEKDVTQSNLIRQIVQKYFAEKNGGNNNK